MIIVDNFEKKCGKCGKKDKAYYFSWDLRIWLCTNCDRINKKYGHRNTGTVK